MRPLLINTFDEGGAATACLRLHKGLLSNNILTKVLVRDKLKNVDNVSEISVTCLEKNIKTKVIDKTNNILKEFNLTSQKTDPYISQRAFGLDYFSYPFSEYDITRSKLYKDADLINLHWVADFLDYPSFFKKNKKPVIWTLHDQNPFSGGEHIEERFLGIDAQGKPIKRELSKLERQIFERNIKIKKVGLENVNNLHIVVLSKWMEEEVRKSEVFRGFEVDLIPNGIDSNVFKPRDKNFCRELLDLPLEKRIILFVSDSFSRNLKGYEFFKRALLHIKNKNVLFLSVGGSSEENLKNVNYKHIGFINDEKLMNVVYCAADVFVIPSLMDNLPNTVIESIMCGTPVIGFPVGGINDMIKQNFNGLLTENVSVAALKDKINEFLNKSDHFKTESIRKDAVERYDISVQVNRYIQLYERLL